MHHYFRLQLALIGRHINDFGLRPALGFILALGLFVGLSFYLFWKTNFAEYAYALMAISLLLKLGERKRNEFLESIFSSRAYIKTRLLENTLIATPFILFLVYEECFITAGALVFSAASLALIQLKSLAMPAIPTPFHKRPFEFAVGFRKTFFLYFIAYLLIFMAIWASNFNLGVFSLLVVFGVILTYYGDLEPAYYIWVHAQKPKAFLLDKIKVATIYSSLISLPITIALCLFNPSLAHIVLAFQGLGYVYLATFILAKYAAYPKNIGLPQSILLAACLVMPPLLVVVIPYFYKQSSRNLHQTLT